MLKLTQLTPSRANTVVLINGDCLGGALSLDELRQLASDAFRRELWAILEEGASWRFDDTERLPARKQRAIG